MDSDAIETLSLDMDIGSSEGLSVDQLARARLQFLIGQNTSILHQTQFADAKAGTLLAVFGVVTVVFGQNPGFLPPLISFALLALTVAIIALCLLAILPQIPGRKQVSALRARELFSWPALTDETASPEGFAGFMRTSQVSHLVVSLARANEATARILQRKYRLLRWALLSALAGLVLLATATGWQLAFALTA